MVDKSNKKLIIFYSLSGNSRLIAESMANEINADLSEIKTRKSLPKSNFLKIFKGGMQVFFKSKPEIFPLDKDPKNYDLIIIGTPVWAGSFVAPLNTLLSSVEIKNKKIALYCCYGGSKGKTFDNLKNSLAGNEFVGEIES
ncbi:MAG: flavodoxin, partial [Bacillota bacterium]|nr:flavodoxin [Bacillota bacterium]